mmetsp:Transcript_126342/g.218938  ORF Transcript_126342/g.218938 Transcript_126342/m.218938 type:complete len:309 (+) Transcript_126342:72-998(+)
MHETANTDLLEKKVYDVTPTAAKILGCCMTSVVLTLEAEEAVKTSSGCLGKSEKRLPYGELGMVDEISFCGCCSGFKSNLSDENPKTKALMPITPGCGCSGSMVDEIVTALKHRMKGRGDTGNIHRSEEAIARMSFMNDKVALLLQKYGIAAPTGMTPKDHAMFKPEAFEEKTYNVTPGCCVCCTSKMLYLEPEEVQLVTKTPCATEKKRFPYGQLGDVTSAKMCCFTVVKSEHLGVINPGMGCSVSLVNEITEELKTRMKARGDTGNIKRQEFANKLAMDQDKMLNAILEYNRIPIPQAPPELQKMV